jgi:hypothetical protein
MCCKDILIIGTGHEKHEVLEDMGLVDRLYFIAVEMPTLAVNSDPKT